MEGHPSCAILLAPVIEVCRDAERRITGHKLDKGRLFFGKNLPQNSKRALVTNENIELAKLSTFLNMFVAAGNSRDITSSIVRTVPKEIADAAFDLNAGERITGIWKVC